MDEKGLLKQAFSILKIFLCYGLIIIAVTTIGKISSIYFDLAQINFILGYLFLALIFLPLFYLAWKIVSMWAQIPSAVNPPSRMLYKENPTRYIKKSLSFAETMIINMGKNPNLSEKDKAKLASIKTSLEHHVRDNKDLTPEDLKTFWEDQTSDIYKKLDDIAEKTILKSAFFTSAGTAVSQNSALDSVIMLYQMISLTINIVKVYWTRPGIIISFGLTKDIIASAGVIVIVSEITTGTYFKKGVSFINKIGDKIPGINVLTGFADEALQGGVTYLLIKRYGKLTMNRCQAIEWDNAEEREELKEELKSNNLKVIDRSKINSEVFDLLGYFSWLNNKQDSEIAICMFDYILSNVPANQQKYFFSNLRNKKNKDSFFENAINTINIFKKGTNPFKKYHQESIHEFLDLVNALRSDDFSQAESLFIKKLQSGQQI